MQEVRLESLCITQIKVVPDRVSKDLFALRVHQQLRGLGLVLLATTVLIPTKMEFFAHQDTIVHREVIPSPLSVPKGPLICIMVSKTVPSALSASCVQLKVYFCHLCVLLAILVTQKE